MKLPVPPELFAATVRALPASGYRGANVTIPHKVAARELADEVSDAVAAIGAANTLTFANGAIRADNTDAGGLIAAIGRAGGRHARPGSGRRRGRPGRGVGAARGGGGGVGVESHPRPRRRAWPRSSAWATRSIPRAADLLVNATSVGLVPGLPEDEALGLLGLARPRPARGGGGPRVRGGAAPRS